MNRLINTEEFIKRIDHYPPDIRDTAKKELRCCKTVNAVPISTLEQIKWERDSFAEQIREIGGEPFAKWDAMDVVKVVRCKECRHKYPYNNVWLCRFGLIIPGPDGFCSYGERATE